MQLVLSGYQLAFACTLVTAARLGDIHGRKKLFLTGMTVFTVASALCGLAPGPDALVLARVLQGFGSGLMFPQVLAVIQVTFEPRQRGKAFGIFGATIGLATILGPLVGGVLIKADLFGTDWRMIFLVNIPVGIGALVLAVRELPESRGPAGRPAGPARRRARHRRAVPARLPAHRGPDEGLAAVAGPHARRRAAGAGRVRACSSAARPAPTATRCC